MVLPRAFSEAVDNGNIREIRIMLKDSLLIDPTFVSFFEMERAASSVAGLYDEHDDRAFESNPDLWNDDYMDKLMVQIVGNFSHERIEHLKEVVKYLRPVKNENPSKQSIVENDNVLNPETYSYQEQKKLDQLSGTYRYAVIGGGAVAGGIVGGAVGTVASINASALAGCVIGGAIVGGAVAAYFTRERR